MRILILGNDPQFTDVLAQRLRAHGFAVSQFTSPHDALEHIQPNDVLVADYELPGMTGLEFAQRAYTEGWRGSFLPMSGHRATHDEEFIPSFLSGVLAKPFSAEE
jgi:DNA-binding response OmpR family regulator